MCIRDRACVTPHVAGAAECAHRWSLTQRLGRPSWHGCRPGGDGAPPLLRCPLSPALASPRRQALVNADGAEQMRA
eukprot:5824984-Alexandrium_andersonii.AAC.1